MLSINTPKKQLLSLRDRFKEKRLNLRYTQSTLANMTGVSLGSIKRFESSGEISLKSFLKLSVTLECLDDFDNIAPLEIADEEEVSLATLQNSAVKKRRGSK